MPTTRHVSLAAVALSALYVALHQRTWSVDGAIHTLASVRPTDDVASGHLLLRSVAWGLTALAERWGPLTFTARYDLLELLFGAFGVAALTLLFRLALLRTGPVPAWLALAAVAIARNTERQITTFDEKPLGMLTFAISLTLTAAAYRRLDVAAAEPRLRDVLPAALAWLVAVFGHLQNAPFAVAAMVGFAMFLRGPARPARWAGLMLKLTPVLLAAALGMLSLLYARDGGLTALPRVVNHLLVDRAKPPAPSGALALATGAAVGQVKSFFLIDRFSPRPAIVAAALGYAVLLWAMSAGLRRARDPLAWVLAAGSVVLWLLMPAANAFAEFGDSYTSAVTAAVVLLAAAPRAALAVGVLVLWGVNLPAAISYSRPETTQRLHLARMIETQHRLDAPWVLLDELTPFDREQGLSPVYYAMSEPLRHERHAMVRLPPGRFLLELPQVILVDGTSPPDRVVEVQRELAARGRDSEAVRLWDPPRLVRADFRRYGDFLVVAPARTSEGTGPPGDRSAPH